MILYLIIYEIKSSRNVIWWFRVNVFGDGLTCHCSSHCIGSHLRIIFTKKQIKVIHKTNHFTYRNVNWAVILNTNLHKSTLFDCKLKQQTVFRRRSLVIKHCSWLELNIWLSAFLESRIIGFSINIFISFIYFS